MMITTSVRLPKELVEEIEKLSREEGLDKGAFVRKLLIESLKEYKIRRALELYRKGKVSLWRAAEMAGMTYREALGELKRRNITFQYDVEDLESDVGWATE